MLCILHKFIPHKNQLGAIGVHTSKTFSAKSRYESESPDVVASLSGVTVHVNVQPFTALHQSRCRSMGIKFETTQI